MEVKGLRTSGLDVGRFPVDDTCDGPKLFFCGLVCKAAVGAHEWVM